MRVGANTGRYTNLSGNRYRHDWNIEPAILEAIPDTEHKVGDEAGDARSSAAYASECDTGKGGNLAG